MNWKHVAMVCALGVAFRPGRAAAAERDLAAEVLGVFSAKCALCHGPQLTNPKSGFGHVLDLRRLAADPEKVVPGKPDESGLWQLVQSGEMPLPNSPAGPLSSEQKETIRAWIAAGAPAGAPAGASARVPAEASAPVLGRTLRWIGKFHLLIVHFPIALMVAAAVGEFWPGWRGRRAPSPAARFCIGLAAASAVPTVVLGWLFALGKHGSSGLLPLHRWIGTVAGGWTVALAVSSEVDARRGLRSWRTRVLLLAGVLLVGVTAHFGGLMVHGKDFYDWPW
jgi:hypothetical protein